MWDSVNIMNAVGDFLLFHTLFFFGGAVPFVLVSTVIYYCVCFVKRRSPAFPLTVVDAATFLIVALTWSFLVEFVPLRKAMGNLLDVVVLGGIFGFLYCLRLPLLWRWQGRKNLMSIVTFLVMLVVTTILTILIPSWE